jgi:hypothetical protein
MLNGIKDHSEGWMDGAEWLAETAVALAKTDEDKALAERLAVMAVEARADYENDPDEHGGE